MLVVGKRSVDMAGRFAVLGGVGILHSPCGVLLGSCV